jgi:hypothetical protein
MYDLFEAGCTLTSLTGIIYWHYLLFLNGTYKKVLRKITTVVDVTFLKNVK